MSLVWHIVCKDFRRLGVGLALWSALLIARTELAVNLIEGDGVNFTHFDVVRLILDLLLVAAVFTNVVLVAFLVQEDPLVGTQMGWATRPISGTRLLAAKILGAALMFGVPPVLSSVRLWLACGDGPREMAIAALGVLDQQLLVLIVAFAFAALTPTIGRFLATLVVVGLGLGVEAFILAWATDGLAEEHLRNHWAVVGVIALPALVVAVVLQFRWRALKPSAWIATVGGATALLAGMCAPWNPASFWRALGEPPVARELAVTVVGAQARDSYAPTNRLVRVDYALRGLPPDLGTQVELSGWWRQADGTVAGGRDGDANLAPALATYRALGVSVPKSQDGSAPPPQLPPGSGRRRGDRAGDNIVSAYYVVKRELVDALMREPARFDGTVECELLRLVAPLEVKPESGREERGHGYGVRITRAVWNENNVLVLTGVETQPAPNFAPPGLTFFLGRARDWSSDIFYALVNHERDRAGNATVTQSEPWVGGGHAVRWFTATLDTRERVAGASLALLWLESAGHARREIHLESLPIAPAPPPE